MNELPQLLLVPEVI